VDTSATVILKGRGIIFQNGRHGIRKSSSLPNVVYHFCILIGLLTIKNKFNSELCSN